MGSPYYAGMEGPSLFLAQQQLKPFKKQTVLTAEGNTSLDISHLPGLTVKDIFSWGKHLVFQFDTFAIRIHFLLYGTFEAEVNGEWVTGDYRRAKTPRLAFTFANGQIKMYNCSVKFIESNHAKKDYDYRIDVMAKEWDAKHVRALVRKHLDEEIADVLLDQEIFAGVGNIIKNEVLFRQGVLPQRLVREISPVKLRAVVEDARTFSKLFLAWRKKFELRKHLVLYRKGICPKCGGKVQRGKTGVRQRWSYWCPVDQK